MKQVENVCVSVNLYKNSDNMKLGFININFEIQILKTNQKGNILIFIDNDCNL